MFISIILSWTGKQDQFAVHTWGSTNLEVLKLVIKY